MLVRVRTEPTDDGLIMFYKVIPNFTNNRIHKNMVTTIPI